MPMSTCALLTSGKIYCWGNNFYGQLGHGRIKGVSLVPQEVVLP
jgi:alpha-tubulin suppressor-like RCC1 family protein